MTDDFDLDINEKDYSEYIIDPVTENQASLNYGLYSELNNHEKHFFELQNRWKLKAASWFFMIFLGIGYIFTKHIFSDTQLYLDPLLIISFIAMCGMGLMSIFWLLESKIYHKLWIAVLVEEANLENNNRAILPPTRLHYLDLINKKKNRFIQSFFYMGCNLILITISLLSVFLYLIKYKKTLLIISLVILLLCLSLVIIWFRKKIFIKEKITINSFRVKRRKK